MLTTTSRPYTDAEFDGCAGRMSTERASLIAIIVLLGVSAGGMVAVGAFALHSRPSSRKQRAERCGGWRRSESRRFRTAWLFWSVMCSALTSQNHLNTQDTSVPGQCTRL